MSDNDSQTVTVKVEENGVACAQTQTMRQRRGPGYVMLDDDDSIGNNSVGKDGQCPPMTKLVGSHIMAHIIQEDIPIDVVISCADGKVGAHRAILAASSPFLGSLLWGQNPGEVATLIFPDVSVSMMSLVLNLVYTGKLVFSEDLESQVFDTLLLTMIGATWEVGTYQVVALKNKKLQKDEPQTVPSQVTEVDSKVQDAPTTSLLETIEPVISSVVVSSSSSSVVVSSSSPCLSVGGVTPSRACKSRGRSKSKPRSKAGPKSKIQAGKMPEAATFSIEPATVISPVVMSMSKFSSSPCPSVSSITPSRACKSRGRSKSNPRSKAGPEATTFLIEPATVISPVVMSMSSSPYPSVTPSRACKGRGRSISKPRSKPGPKSKTQVGRKPESIASSSSSSSSGIQSDFDKRSQTPKASAQVTPSSSLNSRPGCGLQLESGQTVCNLCDGILLSTQTLAKHLITSHGSSFFSRELSDEERLNLLTCQSCDKTLPSISSALDCISSHGLSKCLACFALIVDDELGAHYREVHGVRTSFAIVSKCRWCDLAVAVGPAGLKPQSHVMETHLNKPIIHSNLKRPLTSSGFSPLGLEQAPAPKKRRLLDGSTGRVFKGSGLASYTSSPPPFKSDPQSGRVVVDLRSLTPALPQLLFLSPQQILEMKEGLKNKKQASPLKMLNNSDKNPKIGM